MGLRALASAIQAGLQRQSVISNNIANLQTPGFRARRPQQAALPQGGVRFTGAALQTGAGSLLSTGDPLSVAIQGDAFIAVGDGAGGQAFTRAGGFSLNAQGQLVTADGRQVLPGIHVPPGTTGLQIGRDGTVSGTPPGANQAQAFGQIQVATFANPAGLQSVGGNAFVASPASGAPQFGVLGGTPTDAALGGFVEGSNVDLAREVTDQLVTLRNVQANVRAFRAANDTLDSLLDLI